ncbi:DUF2877 domain-containing protein [Neobacillus cucumis]|uniref:DUF2877 domain-containing protein n=1 Tax=Neobacillus cucumis TaxID=1740721 RepID=UPI0018DF076B|nr:DUF2877 domain-containing protein [Neobacillus cucumis]MBI0577455.1 DUF2877 domain-containing protein [Neobacillus cucumis]
MIFAKSGDVDFIQRVKNLKFSGFVHSTFNRTFNIFCQENSELYTIACGQMDNGPNTIVIEADSFEKLNLEVNDIVYSNHHILYIGDKMAITLERVENWESILPTYPEDLNRLKINLNKMKSYIDIHGKSGGIKKALSQTPFEKEMSNLLEKRTNLLFSELLKNRMSAALQHAVSLIGLGPGLTPSGDDFLVGLFTILNMRHSPFISDHFFCEEVVKKAKDLTNDISFMALKKASAGQVRESIIVLVNSLINGKENELILALKNVLNIGSSSGTDIALGLICGLEVNLFAGGKVCLYKR